MAGERDEIVEIHRGRRFVVTRVRRAGRAAPIVRKALRADAPEGALVALRLEREYRLLTGLRLAGLARPIAFEHDASGPVLLLEDAGAVTLAQWLQRRALAPERFLPIARSLAHALAALHAAGVLHRDIDPRNVVLDLGDEAQPRATLIDFDAAIRLDNHPGGVAPEPDEITPFTAPEATGRTGRLVDARADLYSLGAVFYEMLTGAPPFAHANALELVHAHLAQEPIPLVQLNPAVPPALADLVWKLLAKMPEARYQSAEALAADLDQADARLRATGAIGSFELGLVDLAREMPLPDRLHQRERERAALLAAFTRAAAGDRAAVLVSGAAGVGKSALLDELGAPVRAAGGHLLAGKFDLDHALVPYSALAEALRRWVVALGATPAAERERWRARLDAALEGNARVVSDLCPELEDLLGEATALPALAPLETENRFRLTLLAFVRALAAPAHPLALVLDDVQWADAASLRALRYLALSELPHMLLVLAYRPEPRAELQALIDGLVHEGAATVLRLAPAREEADGALDGMSLVHAAESLSSEVVLDRLLEVLMHLCLSSAGAVRGALVIEEDGEPYLRAIGWAGEPVLLQRTPLARADDVPRALIARVAASGEPLVLADAARHPELAGAEPYLAAHATRSLLVLPIVRLGKALGVLCLENNLATRVFTPARVRVLQLLSSQIAIALKNSLLFEKLTREIAERQRAEARVRFLAESGAALARSLDFETTLGEVARLVVSFLSDWCLIELVVEGDADGHGAGALVPVVASHRDPAQEPALDAGIDELTDVAKDGAPRASVAVVETGVATLFHSLDDGALARIGGGANAVPVLRKLGGKSAMVLPLGSGERRFGALTLVTSRPGGGYEAEDLALGEELARRATLAIDNARLYRQSREAVRQRDELLSIASHELNTPVAVLTLTLANIQKEVERMGSSPSLARLFATAERQGRRLGRLVRDLLDVTRFEAGPLPMHGREVELGALVREAVANFASELERSGCSLELVAPEPVFGHWDPARLDQVVVNLLSNAVKFAPRAPIEIRIDRSGDRAVLSVSDKGIGLPPAAEGRIFNRFARAVAAENYGGLGLGLYICRHLVEAHHGTIAVRSTPGAGATFVVTLPCHPAATRSETAAPPPG